MAIERADHQGSNAEGIACADELLVGKSDKRVGAFELA